MNLPKNSELPARFFDLPSPLTMMIIYLIMAVSAGREYVEATFSGGQNYLRVRHYAGNHLRRGRVHHPSGRTFDSGGNRPGLFGFSEKLVPNARPALDCPVVYPYAPNAVLIGFLFQFPRDCGVNYLRPV